MHINSAPITLSASYYSVRRFHFEAIPRMIELSAVIPVLCIIVGTTLYLVSTNRSAKKRIFGVSLLRKLLDQKHAHTLLELLPDEKRRHLVNPSVCTITFYDGDIPLSYLRERIAAIIKANPFLQSRLVTIPSGMTHNGRALSPGAAAIHPSTFDPTCVDTYLRVVTDVELSPDLPYEELLRRARPFTLPLGRDSIDRDQPLFQVTVFQNKTPGCSGMMVSLCHTIGDGFTFYKVYAMLDPSAPVPALCTERAKRFQEEEGNGEKIGTTYAGWVLALCGALRNKFLRPPMEARVRRVSDEQIAAAKTAHQEREAGTNRCASFLSKNDIITSWFFQYTLCSMGMMVANLRSRKSYLTDQYAGNYLGRVMFYAVRMYLPATIREYASRLSTPQSDDASAAQLLGLNLSIVTNWTSFYRDVQLPGCTQRLHLPVFEMGALPLRNCLVLFQATKEKTGMLLWLRPHLLDSLDDERLVCAL
jgi:hypothetical protein